MSSYCSLVLSLHVLGERSWARGCWTLVTGRRTTASPAPGCVSQRVPVLHCAQTQMSVPLCHPSGIPQAWCPRGHSPVWAMQVFWANIQEQMGFPAHAPCAQLLTCHILSSSVPPSSTPAPASPGPQILYASFYNVTTISTSGNWLCSCQKPWRQWSQRLLQYSWWSRALLLLVYHLPHAQVSFCVAHGIPTWEELVKRVSSEATHLSYYGPQMGFDPLLLLCTCRAMIWPVLALSPGASTLSCK